MERQKKIRDTLTELGALCPSGYSAALHFGFHSPDFLFQTYPTQWREEYTRDSLVLMDPALRWGMENEGQTLWSEIPGSADNEVMERARAHGICFGFTLAIGAPTGRSILNAARADREFNGAEISDIKAKFETLHDLTQDLDELSEEISAELRARSIDVTHGMS